MRRVFAWISSRRRAAEAKCIETMTVVRNGRKHSLRPLSTAQGDTGMFESLPLEILFEMLKFLPVQELAALCSVSRKMNYIASHDILWQSILKSHFPSISHDLGDKQKPCKQIYITTSTWKWDAKRKADPIEVNDCSLTASRKGTGGTNPAVSATRALTKKINSFEVEIKERGAWLGIGFCDNKYRLHMGSTLGTQTQFGSVNSAFFCQDSTLLQMSGVSSVNVEPKLAAGDRVRIEIDFDENTVYYYRNGALQGFLRSESPLEEGKLYPCVNLSRNTTVTFVHE